VNGDAGSARFEAEPAALKNILFGMRSRQVRMGRPNIRNVTSVDRRCTAIDTPFGPGTDDCDVRHSSMFRVSDRHRYLTGTKIAQARERVRVECRRRRARPQR
jgi:hypothetical protein